MCFVARFIACLSKLSFIFFLSLSHSLKRLTALHRPLYKLDFFTYNFLSLSRTLCKSFLMSWAYQSVEKMIYSSTLLINPIRGLQSSYNLSVWLEQQKNEFPFRHYCFPLIIILDAGISLQPFFSIELRH